MAGTETTVGPGVATTGDDKPHYQALFARMLNGIAYCRVLTEGPRPHDFVYLEVNEAFERLTGLKDVVGRRVTEVIPQIRETDPELLNTYSEVAVTGRARTFETYVEALGEWFSVSAYCPAPGHFVAVFDVVTEPKRVQEDLRKSEARLQALIEHSTDIIAVIDGEGRTTFASPSLAASLGRSTAMVGGKPILDFVHRDDRPELVRALDRVFSAPGATASTLVRVEHMNGSWRYIEAVGCNQLDNPAIRGVVVNARDVTEHRRLEEQFRHAQKLESVGRLAGGVAHDFNNLLTVIRAATGEMREALSEGKPIDPELVEEVDAASERATQLTRQLLAVGRRTFLRSATVSLNEIVGGTAAMLGRILGEDVELRLQLDPQAGAVWCDRGEIEQVLMNLVVNARDAMPHGGRLLIETRNVEYDEKDVQKDASVRIGRWTQLRVTDSGTGFSPEAMAHLFEPFFTTKATGKGTGLGLATVHGIVTQSGGHVHVESQLEIGTTIRVCLPRSDQDAEGQPERSTTARPSQGSEVVLVVEDDPSVRDVMRRALAAAGYQVKIAMSSTEALALPGEMLKDLGLLVTDVVMPGPGGVEVAQAVRRLRPGLPVLFVSGYPRDAFAGGLPTESGIGYLPKPFTSQEFLNRVRGLLDRR